MSATGIDYICFGLLAPKLVLVEVLMLLLVAQICDDLHWPLLQHPGPFLHLLCVGGPALLWPRILPTIPNRTTALG